jgi:chromosome segregation ATPase
MMSQVVPTDAALSGALALVQVALDPKAAKDALDRIAKAKAELNAQLADLSERQQKLNQTKIELQKAREEHASAIQHYASEIEGLDRAKAEHERIVKAFGQADARFREGVAETDARHRARDAELTKRERSVADRGREIDALVAATDKREQALNEREEAIARGEADLREKRAKLEAVLA